MDGLQGVTRVHLVGVGGIGVSALAPALVQRGMTVTGSDPSENEVTRRLSALGVAISRFHHADHVRGADLVVATSAVSASNPEIQAASQLGIPVWPRARMLGALLSSKKTIIVTGAHGKTTITGMITHMLMDCGMDPTAFIGGDLPVLGNSRVGDGEWAVAEGDESDGSFTFLPVSIAIVNNIDNDHLDFYESMDAIQAHFQTFVSAIHAGSVVFLSADCPRTSALVVPEGVKVIRYGFSEQADIRAMEYASGSSGCRASVVLPGEERIFLRLPMTGQYNIHNALPVLGIARQIGIPMEATLSSLQSFPGVKRRMEIKGEINGVRVLDDYAHHPNEIRATVTALKERYSGRLVVMFQPHLYSRTLNLLDDFRTCFEGVDRLILTDIYAARETAPDGVSGRILFEKVRETGVPVTYTETLDDVAAQITPTLESGDVFVTMGAGDGWRVGEQVVDRLQSGGAA